MDNRGVEPRSRCLQDNAAHRCVALCGTRGTDGGYAERSAGLEPASPVWKTGVVTRSTTTACMSWTRRPGGPTSSVHCGVFKKQSSRTGPTGRGMHGRQGSNLLPAVLETAVQPVAPHPHANGTVPVQGQCWYQKILGRKRRSRPAPFSGGRLADECRSASRTTGSGQARRHSRPGIHTQTSFAQTSRSRCGVATLTG